MVQEEEQYDTIIVGAGFSGIHQLVHLQKLGLRCMVIEAGSDFGGTWYWNMYPSARVDSNIPLYELALPEIWKKWLWMEKFPAQPELQACIDSYFTFVGDKLDLRPHRQFDTIVKQAHWDDKVHVWSITAEGKDGVYKATARYLILCMGFAVKFYTPDINGLKAFKGQICHKSRWPKGGFETTGKRVGVVGTGASGVQIIQELGPEVGHMTVFQWTPNMALPMHQHSVSQQMQDHFRPMYEDLFKRLPTTVFGFPHGPIPRPLLSHSEEEREAHFENLWDLGRFNFLVRNYQDILIDKASNYIMYAFWRKKVSEHIRDPRKHVLLAPEVAPHAIGAKHASLEQCFYEVFNQENVDLVDIKATPILEMYENGLKMADKQYELDVLIVATGFDSYVGGFNNIDLRGLGGETIQDHWKNGMTTYLGMSIDNFPNLFFTYGPQGPMALCNAPTCLQLQSSWIAQAIGYLRELQVTKFTPMTHAALTYKKHVEDLCNATLLPQVDSWYMGANIPGKKREAYDYLGGVAMYRLEIMAEAERGYPGFQRETLQSRVHL